MCVQRIYIRRNSSERALGIIQTLERRIKKRLNRPGVVLGTSSGLLVARFGNPFLQLSDQERSQLIKHIWGRQILLELSAPAENGFYKVLEIKPRQILLEQPFPVLYGVRHLWLNSHASQTVKSIQLGLPTPVEDPTILNPPHPTLEQAEFHTLDHFQNLLRDPLYSDY